MMNYNFNFVWFATYIRSVFLRMIRTVTVRFLFCHLMYDIQ